MSDLKARPAVPAKQDTTGQSLRDRLEKWASEVYRDDEQGYCPAHTAGQMLALLWPCVNYLTKAGRTHCPPEMADMEFQEGYQQALDDIREWANKALAELEAKLGPV